jgi:phage FluMu protein Com
MNAPLLNAIDCPCACGSKARVTASGSGALTVYCPNCKFQGFAKSPKSVTALQARIGVTPAADRPAGRPAGTPAEKKPGSGLLDEL